MFGFPIRYRTDYGDWRDWIDRVCMQKLEVGCPPELLCERCWKIAIVRMAEEVEELLPNG